MNQYCMFY